MNKFAAEKLFVISQSLGELHAWISKSAAQIYDDTRLRKDLKHWVRNVEDHARFLGLRQSEKCAQRFRKRLRQRAKPDHSELNASILELSRLVHGELADTLFLWVPGHRADWYGKPAAEIVGTKCAERFKSIQREIEEAAKCYAVGRFTAAAFHLMRSTEAGLKALSKAIGFTPTNDRWGEVLTQIGNEFNMKPSKRPIRWHTHGKFLERVWADLRAVNKAWRNNVAHLVDNYSEEESKDLLIIIPMFLRDLATKIDENGIFLGYGPVIPFPIGKQSIDNSKP